MKRYFKYASGLFLTGLLSVLIIFSANAQRGGGARRGGGGGFHGGGGIGFSHRWGGSYFAGPRFHGGAFFRPGFGYYGYPHIGFYLNVLPFGYYPFYWDSFPYYYYGGVFYRPYENGGYVVTAPPIGAAIPNLPDNANPIKVDGVQYYELDGVYYKEGVNDKGKKVYIVAGKDGVLNTDGRVNDPNASFVAPQIGDVVNQLPDGCRKVILNGKNYFVSPTNIYYENVTDPDGNPAYRIVSLPDDGKIN